MVRTGICAHCGAGFEDRTQNRSKRFCTANCRKRHGERAEAARGRCSDCATLLGVGSQCRAVKRCRDCYHALELSRVAARGHEMERLWAAGKTQREIAAHFGWSLNRVSVEFAYRRAEGFDLPHRYRMRDGVRVAA